MVRSVAMVTFFTAVCVSQEICGGRDFFGRTGVGEAILAGNVWIDDFKRRNCKEVLFTREK